jgi:hypothetical protein
MATHLGYTAKVLAWLQKGRRCDIYIAGKRLGCTIKQYQRAIQTLKRTHHIDSDIKAVKDKKGVVRYIASHQLNR